MFRRRQAHGYYRWTEGEEQWGPCWRCLFGETWRKHLLRRQTCCRRPAAQRRTKCRRRRSLSMPSAPAERDLSPEAQRPSPPKLCRLSQQTSDNSFWTLNPLDSKDNSAASNNTKLIHWSLMGGLLHLVQRGGALPDCGPAQSPPRCTVCKAHPSTASVPITVLL